MSSESPIHEVPVVEGTHEEVQPTHMAEHTEEAETPFPKASTFVSTPEPSPTFVEVPVLPDVEQKERHLVPELKDEPPLTPCTKCLETCKECREISKNCLRGMIAIMRTIRTLSSYLLK